MTSSGANTPPAESDRRRRRRRLLTIAGVIGVVAIIGVVVYFEPQTLFIDDEVNETLPGLDAVLADTTAPTLVSPSPVATGQDTPEPDATQADPTPPETTGVDTAAPAATVPVATDATAAADGEDPATAPESSIPMNPAPDTASDEAATSTAPATTPDAPANSISASLEEAAATGLPVVVSTGEFFSGEHSTHGTALVVALPDGSVVVRFEDLDTSNGPDLRVVLSPDEASESWDYGGRLILDGLKGNIGDQNYAIGDDIDLTAYRSVVIWCERFSVAFGAAAIDVQA